MKRLILCVLSISLTVSLATPSGVVFASEGENAIEATTPTEVTPVLTAPPSVEPSVPPVSVPDEPTTPAPTPTPSTAKSLATPEQVNASPTQLQVQATPTPAQPVVTQPAPVYASDDVLVSAFMLRSGRGFDFIEVHNTTTDYVKVDGMTIRLLYSSETTDYACEINLSGHIRPSSYVTYAQNTTSDGSYPMNGCPNPGSTTFDNEIQVYRDGGLVESVRIASANLVGKTSLEYERSGWTSTYRSGTLSKDFKVSMRPALTSALYNVPDAPALQFVEIFPRALLCASDDTDAVCRSYIKLKNTSDQPIDLSKFRLRGGSPASNSTASNTSTLVGVVPANGFLTIRTDAAGKSLKLNDSEGTAWLEDALGFTSYQNSVTPYHDAELVTQTGRSWAFDESDGQWKWATPSPLTLANDFRVIGMGSAKSTTSIATSTLKPCADNQYRSEETNRCRLIATAASSLTPCKEGQYRSEETNRCRSVASAASSSLKPCNADQFRNPDTGRCKKIESATSQLKPCAAGQERNPETNRCRKVAATLASTPFAVAPTKSTGKSFVGWWALGGLGTLAAGYAAWEWRQEIGRGFKRVGAVFWHSK